MIHGFNPLIWDIPMQRLTNKEEMDRGYNTNEKTTETMGLPGTAQLAGIT